MLTVLQCIYCFLGYPVAARLVDGQANSSGIVELLYNGAWTKICVDTFDERKARVVCRQLGFEHVLNVTKLTPNLEEHYNPALNWSSLSCAGDETNIAYCNGTVDMETQTPCASMTYLSLECGGGECKLANT